MLKMILRLLSLCTALTLVSPHMVAAQSQATTAEINGRITDAQGGVLPGATVTVKNSNTGYSREVIANEEGLFSIPLLPPGEYEVSISLAGFSTVTRKALTTVGSVVTLNQALNVASVTESVIVEAASPLVETSATIRTTTVSQDAIANLPINGRRFQDFITLTPTVQVDPQRGQLSFAGQRGINANVSVDGADYNQPFFGGIRGGERSNNAFTLPQEAVQEFQVVAAGYSAEFGRSTGGLVNAITKSGSNTLHGSAFLVTRNVDWAENNAFGQQAAPTQTQFGGSVGGPIKRDRLFFFGVYEQQDFNNEREVAFNLTGVTRSADNAEAYDLYRSLEAPFDATNDANAILGRIDYQFAAGKRLAFRYNYSKNKALNSNATGNALDSTTTSALSNNGTEKDNTNTFVGQYTSPVSNTWLLEARAQYSREERPREANELAPTVQNAVGNYGTVNFLPTTQFDWRVQGAANITGLKGNHTFKFGTEYNHVFVDQLFGFNQFGRWTVNGGAAGVLEVMSLGGPTANRFDVPGGGGGTTATYLKQLGNLALDFSTNELAFYAQDTWRLTSRFTFNYGIRWEGAWNPTPEANNEFMLNALNGFQFPLGTVDPTQIPDQLNQWGPRVGFAWDATGDGKTVVRGYSGLYYARTPAIIWAGPMNNFRVPAGDLSVQLPFTAPTGNPNNTLYKQLLLIGINLNNFPLDQLPILTTEQITAIGSALGLTVNPFFGAQPILVDEDFKNPRATQAGFGVEREFLPGATVGAEFTYVKTDNLQRNREYNLALPVPTGVAQRPTFPTPRPLAALGSVQLRESSAESEFTALTLTSRVSKPWGLVSANYVLSKSMSDDDNERDSGGVQFENTYDLGPEWSPARLDRRHQFNGYAIFYLPYNFDVTTGYRFLSGVAIDATFGSDINNSRGGADRPYSAPGVPFERNAFRNESFKEVNFKVQWALPFNNGSRLLLYTDLFNVFNWDNIQLAGTAVTNYCAAPVPADCGFGEPTNPTFLSLTDTSGNLIRTNNPGLPRQIQFGARFQF